MPTLETHRLLFGAVALAAFVATLLAITPAPAGAATAMVTSGADAGPGSFRHAIEDANADPSITVVRFAKGLTVELVSPVVYEGEQDLVVDGRGSTVSGATAAKDTDTWDGGLLVNSTASGNEDGGVKVDEEDDGSIAFRLVNSDVRDSASQDGVQLEEQDDGDLAATVVNATVTGNDNDGVKAEQGDAGGGTLEIVNSDLSGNGGDPVDADGVSVTVVNSTT